MQHDGSRQARHAGCSDGLEGRSRTHTLSADEEGARRRRPQELNGKGGCRVPRANRIMTIQNAGHNVRHAADHFVNGNKCTMPAMTRRRRKHHETWLLFPTSRKTNRIMWPVHCGIMRAYCPHNGQHARNANKQNAGIMRQDVCARTMKHRACTRT